MIDGTSGDTYNLKIEENSLVPVILILYYVLKKLILILEEKNLFILEIHGVMVNGLVIGVILVENGLLILNNNVVLLKMQMMVHFG